jgi:hypothetical protein
MSSRLQRPLADEISDAIPGIGQNIAELYLPVIPPRAPSRRTNCSFDEIRHLAKTAVDLPDTTAAQKTILFNHIVRGCFKCQRHLEAKRFGSSEVDGELELGRSEIRFGPWLRKNPPQGRGLRRQWAAAKSR